MRLIGVVGLERPLGGHEVPSDQVGEVARQGTQLFQDFLVELLRRDVGRHLGQPLTLGSLVGTLAIGPAVPGAGPPSTGTVLAIVPGERTGVPVTAALTPVAVTTLAMGTTVTLATRTAIVTEPALTARPETTLATVAEATLAT
ncbi:hypothetical protein, partial [Nonomuraea solani]|uniref:hypothetical protein n=1 Tax=Nonomuraea solani TaxID=1144553 RepID=UPI001F1B47BC